jgi:hypothetical protein
LELDVHLEGECFLQGADHHMTRRKGRFAYTLAALFVSCAATLAQSTSGDITGTIYDATGATIPAAAITATNTATGVQTSTTSTSSGQYRLSNLLVGTYNLSISAPGFTKAELKNVSVELNKVSTANVTLAVGTAATSVEVSAASATIDTTSAQIQNNFETRQLQDSAAASQGSGVINLSLLNAGVATTEKMAVFAPMPIASAPIAVNVNTGVLHKFLTAYRMS